MSTKHLHAIETTSRDSPSPTSSPLTDLSATESELFASLVTNEEAVPSTGRQTFMDIIGEQAQEIAHLQITVARYQLKETIERRQSMESVDCFAAALGRLAGAVEHLGEVEQGAVEHLGEVEQGAVPEAMERVVGMFVELRQAIAELAGMDGKDLEGMITRSLV